MGQRSPYNDRYKVEQKGKTRRSASSAKPKREIADLTPARTEKKPEKKKGFFSRGQAASRPAAPVIENSPRMKDLRRMWWVMWVVALGMAVGILLLQQGGKAYVSFIPYGWALWIVAMGGAFYLEFFPIRKERAAMVAAAQAARSGKSGKAEKQAAPAKSEKTKKRTQGATAIPAPDDRQPPPPEDPA